MVWESLVISQPFSRKSHWGDKGGQIGGDKGSDWGDKGGGGYLGGYFYPILVKIHREKGPGSFPATYSTIMDPRTIPKIKK